MTKKTLANMQVRIGGDTKELESSFKKAQKQFNTFKVGVAAITATASAAIAGTIALTNKAADYADQIDKSSIRTGLARDTIQSLAYVSDQAGLGFDKIEDSLKDVTISMGNALAGTKAQVDAYKQLGIEVTDSNGRLRKVADVYPEVISKLSEMTNEAERNVLGTKLMGESAIEVVPKLSALGKDGLQQLIDKSKDLNLVMGNKSIATLVEYKDNMSTLKQQFQATMREGTIPFAKIMNNSIIPALSKSLEYISDWSRSKLGDTIKDQAVKVNSLVIELTENNTKEERRKKIYDELNKVAPEVVANLNRENISISKLKVNLELYNEALIKKLAIQDAEEAKEEALKNAGEARGKRINEEMTLRTNLAKKLTRILEDNHEMLEEIEKTEKGSRQRVQLSQRIESNKELIQTLRGVNAQELDLVDKAIEYNKAIAKSNELRAFGEVNVERRVNSISGIQDVISAREHESDANAEVTMSLEKYYKKYKLVFGDVEAINHRVKNSMLRLELPKINFDKALDPTSALANLEEEFKKTAERLAKTNPFKISNSLGDGTVTKKMELQPIFPNEIVKEYQRKMQLMKDLTAEATMAIEGEISNMITSIAEGFGQLVTGDIGFGDFFKTVLSTFGQFMVQMGGLLVAYGVAMKAFAIAAKNPTNPISAGVLIAAGAAMAAAGAAIVALSSAGPNGSGSGSQSNEATYDTRTLSTANLGAPNMSTAAVPYNGNTAEMNVNVSIQGKIGHDAIYLSNKQGEKTVKTRG